MGSALKKQRPNESVELTSLDRRVRTRSIIEAQDDFEDCVLVWLDAAIARTDDWTDELSHARELINNVKVFDKLNECINFMKMIVTDKIFLVVSHQFIHSICVVKSEIRLLTAIYVYCDESLTALKRIQLETWARTNEPLITGVYNDSADCFAQLAKDVHDICDHDSIPMTFLNPQAKSMTLRQASPFLIFQSFVQNILRRLPSPNTASEKQRVFRSCLYYYRDNDKRLEEIKHFQEHYQPEAAIDWYLRTPFLCRLLHKASQTMNFLLLFEYSYILNDIHRLVTEKSTGLIDVPQTEIFYRAQKLNTDDLYRLRMNVNGIVSINCYLELCRTAEAAVSEITLKSNNLETVVYHFSLDHSYASISDSKVLLAMGASFRIQHIGMEMDGMWHVRLNLLPKEEVSTQMDVFLKELDGIPHEYLTIGLLWDKNKQTSKADRFYRILIDRLPKTDLETAAVCNHVGVITRLKCQHPSAVTYHHQALQIYEEQGRIHHAFNEEIDRTHVQLALVYREMGDIVKAIGHFKLGIKQGEEVANYIAEIYRNLEQFSAAHQYYQQTRLYNNIGLCYLHQSMFPQALAELKKAGESMSHINLGVYHQLRKEYSTALVFFEKALENVKDHPLDTAMVHSYLGLLHCDRRQWLLSLRHYEQALDLYKRHLISNHPTIALVHDGLGTLYLTKGEFRAAQREFERCLELQLRVLPPNHPDVAGTYNNLGGVFNELGEYEDALLYHYEALAAASATLAPDHSDVKLYEHNVTETKRKLS